MGATKKSIIDMEGPSRTSVWVIAKDGRMVGRIIAAFPKKGHGERPTYVMVNDWTPNGDTQKQRAGGFGYDKVDACLERMTFDGLTLRSGWEIRLEEAGYNVFKAL